MNIDRRHFMMGLGAAAGSLALPDLGYAGGQDYRALVCVFFLGGLDNYDTVIPYDDPSYNRWASVRQSLRSVVPGYRDRNTLLELPTSGFEGRRFALPAEMSELQALFSSGKAAIVGNVGPLLEPVDRTSFKANTAMLPARLFSHNDQQATWFSGLPEGASQFGWGGQFADIARASNSGAEFTAITTGGSQLFVTGQAVSPYQISSRGAVRRNLFRQGENEGFVDRLADEPPSVRELLQGRYRDPRMHSNRILTDLT
ncbi:MAG: hypothetical protein AAF211_12265, partial [Myxococcota bacterium]